MRPVYVLPPEPQQLTAPQSGRKLEVVHFVHAAVLCFMEERAELVGGERVHFLVLDLRQGTGGATGGKVTYLLLLALCFTVWHHLQ